jgi:signal transduction histidine kinase
MPVLPGSSGGGRRRGPSVEGWTWCICQIWARGREVIALGAPLIALALQFALWPVVDPYVWFFFFPATFVASYFGSARSSVIATVASAGLVWYFFLPPRFDFKLKDYGDLWMVVIFVALGAAITMVNHRARTAEERSAAAESVAQRARERERIARDLHETVIQRLFAVTLGVEASLWMEDPDPARQRLREVNEELNQVISAIRTTIFDLRFAGCGSGVKDEIVRLVSAAAARLGCPPQVHFVGPLDAAVGDETEVQLLAVLSEALSNIVRHAQATSLTVSVEIAGKDVVLTVADDGIGMPRPLVRGDGLENMSQRAADLNGRWTIEPNRPRGTVVRWSAPVDVRPRR